MHPTRSLRAAFTWWFAATLVVLYGVVATAVWLYSRTSDRHYAILTLKAEGEAVAGYLTATGRLDAPEFAGLETAPFPIWFRLWQGGSGYHRDAGRPRPGEFEHPGPKKDEFLAAWAPSMVHCVAWATPWAGRCRAPSSRSLRPPPRC